MKRLNPKTGKPFKQGDLREDGFIFKSYTPSQIKKDGFFFEDWRSPKAFANFKKFDKIHKAKKALTFRGRADLMLGRSRSRAKNDGIEHNIVLEDILPSIEAGFCQLTKLPFDLKPVTKTSQNAYAPSIDRIDSLKGYTKDNIRIVLYAVNAALGQYGTEILLPILKAMIIGIENAQQKSAAPISEGSYNQGAVGAELRSVSTPWTWEDGDDIDNYRGATQGKNAYHSAKEGGGDSVVSGSTEVVAPSPLTRIEDHGQPEPEIIRLDFGRRYLSD